MAASCSIGHCIKPLASTTLCDDDPVGDVTACVNVTENQDDQYTFMPIIKNMVVHVQQGGGNLGVAARYILDEIIVSANMIL